MFKRNILFQIIMILIVKIM